MNIILYPRPKINIGLRVTSLRPDGYHNIHTLFYPVDAFTDVLEIIEADKVSMVCYGSAYRPQDGDMEQDLCVRAYRLLQREFDLPPVGIYLHKNIPVGAGLGGGSADAAYTLAGLNSLFSLGLDCAALADYAAQLGSDCAFFVYRTPMYGSGRGEILSPCKSPSVARLQEDYCIKVVACGIPVSTAKAYACITPDPTGDNLPALLDSVPISEWKDFIINDFEGPVFAAHPQIRKIKEDLYAQGAVYASMSGSGSAVYGIFEK